VIALLLDAIFASLAIYYIDRWYLRVPAAFVMGLFSSVLVAPIMSLFSSGGEALIAAFVGAPIHAVLTAVLSVALFKKVRAWKARREAEKSAQNWRSDRPV
jgi:hypothetical protein